jgi:hypothetical protein
MSKNIERDSAEILVPVIEAYAGYLDSMISMLEAMLTPEQLEEIELKLKEGKDNEK